MERAGSKPHYQPTEWLSSPQYQAKYWVLNKQKSISMGRKGHESSITMPLTLLDAQGVQRLNKVWFLFPQSSKSECHQTSFLTLDRLWNHSGPQLPQLSHSAPPLPASRSFVRFHKVILVKSFENHICKSKTILQSFNTDKTISHATDFALLF